MQNSIKLTRHCCHRGYPRFRVLPSTRVGRDTVSPFRFMNAFIDLAAGHRAASSSRQEDTEMMIRTEEQIKKLAKLTSVMLMATAEAMAADNQSAPQRKIVVSLEDRKLAVVEAGRVV